MVFRRCSTRAIDELLASWQAWCEKQHKPHSGSRKRNHTPPGFSIFGRPSTLPPLDCSATRTVGPAITHWRKEPHMKDLERGALALAIVMLAVTMPVFAE